MNTSVSFYIAYPANKELRSLINSLKILADDNQRTEAHITVRGPYKKKLSAKDIEKFSKIVSGETLNISGVDNFFAFNQNTVFFKIDENEKLRKVWKKITYNDFKPHITIYDGKDREYAIKLFNILRHNFSPFQYRVGNLSWLEPKVYDELKLFHLKSIFNYEIIEQIINKSFSRETISNISTNERLKIIMKVANYLYNGFEESTIANT